MPDNMDMKPGQGGVFWADDKQCLVCGTENPFGLKLRFEVVDDGLRTEWIAEKRFQGYAGVLHGGIIATILDETMVNLPWKRDGIPVISAEMSVRFIQPAKIGDHLVFTSRVSDVSKRLISATSICKTASGTLIA